MGFPIGKWIKRGAAAGGRALLRRYGHEAEKKVIELIAGATAEAQDKATVVVTKAFDGLDKKDGIGGGD